MDEGGTYRCIGGLGMGLRGKTGTESDIGAVDTTSLEKALYREICAH